MNDVFTHYEEGLINLLEGLGRDHADYEKVLIFEQRLRENIAQTRDYGGTETRRAERAQIAEALNQLALRASGVSFNKLCGFPISRKRLGVFLDLLFIRTDLPPDIPLHERVANLLMISLGQISNDAFAVMMQLSALLVFGSIFAWWLAQSNQNWTNEIWGHLGIVWLGLTILPLIAGFLPQRRERYLHEEFSFTTRQRLALWLDKASGTYISAYLGEMAAVVVWLGLNYLGLWRNMSTPGKVTFWLIIEWFSFALSFVGAVIATKYWENLLRGGQCVDLKAQHLLLGLGFPLVVFPAMMLFALATASFWERWQTGSVAIGSSFLILAWMLSREFE